MASTTFSIPEEFQSLLKHVGPLDTRTDTDILSTLSHHQPITSEKNIWAYWDKGINALPAWNTRNIINWVRLCGPTWTVRILDNIPTSPNYALNYVSKDLLPDTFVNSTMRGPYIGPHSADFLRGACLYLHGGVFMDVGILLICDLDRICWNQLVDPSSPFEVSTPIMVDRHMANHFVAARKGNEFVKAWHDIFCEIWKGKQDYKGVVSQNPLMAFAAEPRFIDFGRTEEAGFHFDFDVDPLTVFEYVGQVLSWNRLCMLENTGRGFSGVKYWCEKVLVFDALQECWGAEATIGWPGHVLFDALSAKVDGDRDSQAWKNGYEVVWRLLTRSSLQKVTHGKNLTKTPAIGLLWDQEGNEEKDCEQGTWAEVLRYGQVHFQQTREEIAYVKAARPESTLKQKLLEP